MSELYPSNGAVNPAEPWETPWKIPSSVERLEDGRLVVRVSCDPAEVATKTWWQDTGPPASGDAQSGPLRGCVVGLLLMAALVGVVLVFSMLADLL